MSNITYEKVKSVVDFFDSEEARKPLFSVGLGQKLPEYDCFFDVYAFNPKSIYNPFCVSFFIIHCCWLNKHDR